MYAVIEAQKLADDRAEYNGENGDERILSRQHAVRTDVEHAQCNAFFNRCAHVRRDEPAEQDTGHTACDDRGGVDDGAGQDHWLPPSFSFSYPASVRMTSPAIINPAQPGTQTRLAGTLRRPGGGASSACGFAGSSGE